MDILQCAMLWDVHCFSLGWVGFKILPAYLPLNPCREGGPGGLGRVTL
jgi:hypothetical protein